MIRYHINSATGEPGRCSARSGHCPFGGDDDHFTSSEAARANFEKTQETFPKKWVASASKLDLEETLARGEALDAHSHYDSLADQEPIGSVLLRVHHESDTRSYLAKAEDGQWYPVIRSDLRYTFAKSPATKEQLTASGSVGYYFAKPSGTFREMLARLQGDENKKAVEKIAKHLHSSIKYGNFHIKDTRLPRGLKDNDAKIQEFVDVPYVELPASWKTHYEVLANAALEAIADSKAYGGAEYIQVPTKIFEKLAEYYGDDDFDAEAQSRQTRGSLNEILRKTIWVVKTWPQARPPKSSS